ncbi:MAG: CDP-diacylglycerol--glycerol-3-phosphate 3-phosphatidyltransferase [Pseudomonadota bacterium]
MRLLPNILTVSRCLVVVAIALCLAWPFGELRTAALILFVVAAVTDWLDGFLARALSVTSDFGRMLDPIADKLLFAVTALMLCANGTIDGFNAFAAAMILAREIAIAGLREHLGARGVTVPASLLAKWKTTVQLVALALLLAAPLLPLSETVKVLGLLGLWAAMVMTIWTGGQYAWAARAAWGKETAP